MRTHSRAAHGWALSLTLTASLLLGACSKSEGEDSQGDVPSESEVARLDSPRFQVKPNMENALFTWVDKDGSFQLTDNPSDVPAHARKTVRVVVEGHSPGGPEHVYVVDLTGLESGAELPVRSITRTEWETLGKKERDSRIAQLAPPDEPKAPSPQDLNVDAIVYGADWCKPCHLAEAYLKKKGARVIKKDIEEDPAAASEMRQKLTRAGMGGSSIPILDIGGTILKGFSEGAVDAALKRAGGSLGAPKNQP
jgi:glutaredoxin